LKLPFLEGLKFESTGHGFFMMDHTTFAFEAFGLLGICPSKYRCQKMFLTFGWLRCVVMLLKYGDVESFNNFIAIIYANAMEFIHLNLHQLNHSFNF
jgi:hypothetical protein